jgi:16S rRNA (guanine1207-N2)-methyltransferase
MTIQRPIPPTIAATVAPTVAASTTALYGRIPVGLRDVGQLDGVGADARQCAPTVPGAAAAFTDLADMPPASLDGILVHAPANTIERRRVLALALRAVKPQARLTVFAANDKGGTRLAAELQAFGCTVTSASKQHHRIVQTTRPDAPTGLEAAIADGAPRLIDDIGAWSMPGLFSWDRLDPGSALLLDHLPALNGRGADLGCGIGLLARAVIAGGGSKHLTLIDVDRRATEMAARNVGPVDGVTVTTLWADARDAKLLPTGLHFVVMNPPFHDAGQEDRGLGQAFITAAARMLGPGGHLWMTANRHLPYEATLAPLFQTVEKIAEAQGYKIYRADKARR